MSITSQPEILRPGQRPVGRRANSQRSDSQRSDSQRSDSQRPARPASSLRASSEAGLFSDKNLDLLSHLLDDFIRIPGTPIRFGLDGIVGFIPGIGDLLGGLASTIIIVAAWARGVPHITVIRMLLNVGIETAVGSIPVLGNLFDIGWRANRRNYALLIETSGNPDRNRRGDWLFFALVFPVLTLIVLAPMLLLGWLILYIEHALLHGRG